jgi:hypothetical protein
MMLKDDRLVVGRSDDSSRDALTILQGFAVIDRDEATAEIPAGATARIVVSQTDRVLIDVVGSGRREEGRPAAPKKKPAKGRLQHERPVCSDHRRISGREEGYGV